MDESCSAHPEHMLHVVEARRPALQPERRPDGPGGIDPPVEAAMGQRDVLGAGGEEQRVLAHHLPAAQGREDALVMAIELVDGDLQAMPPL